MLSKPGSVCTSATCMADGSWSEPMCVADVDPGCDVSGLGTPDGASIVTEACMSGSEEVPSRGVCEFTKPGHVCSTASCVAGTWSAAMCVVMPGCLFSALVVPSGASASGHENCHSDAVEPVPGSVPVSAS